MELPKLNSFFNIQEITLNHFLQKKINFCKIFIYFSISKKIEIIKNISLQLKIKKLYIKYFLNEKCNKFKKKSFELRKDSDDFLSN